MPLDLAHNAAVRTDLVLSGKMDFPETSPGAIAARFRLLIEVFADGNTAEFCRQCGISYQSFRKTLEGRSSKVQLDDAYRVFVTHNVDLNWTLAGQMTSLPPDLYEAIRSGRLNDFYKFYADAGRLEGWPW